MIALAWDAEHPTPDLAATATGAIATEEGLRTAVLLSLFLDARAGAEDRLPDPRSTDRRGWVGDALAPVAGDRFGSRLWLLGREMQTEDVRQRAERYGQEALAWLIGEGLAMKVGVTASWIARGYLSLRVQIAELGFDETFEVAL